MITIALLMMVGAVASNLQVGQVYQFRSRNYPKRMILVRKDFTAWVKVSSNANQYNSFIVVKGLAGRGISFRSSTSARYLRHRGGKCYMDPGDGTKLFKRDASFIQVTGLTGDKNSVSFRSVNSNSYIRHAGWRLRVNKYKNKNLFKKDATYFPITVHGSWRGWGKYGACSTTCGAGVTQRSRSCRKNALAPRTTCVGSSYETKSCKVAECPVHPCDKPTKGGCEQTCNKDGKGVICSCTSDGFKLGADGKSCIKGLRCNGQDSGCCTEDTPCDIGEGDCDSDHDCTGSLVCGDDNCPWGDNDECCRKA